MAMKLKFIDQQYQTDAVNSIVDIFEGCHQRESLFTIDLTRDINYDKGMKLEGEGVSYELGYANKCSLSDEELLINVRNIQEKNFIKKSTDIQGRNFSVEMETGTGKTYVYTKTILEMNKRYGFTKFIIVVPGIAIKEGVYKSLNITEEHFKLRYNNIPYTYFVYDSNKLNRIQQFATSSNIEIMIINIDAFKKSFDDPTKENKANIIHRPSDRLSGNKPIDLIAGVNPIVIIDEPQSVDNTPKAKEAIKSLNPLCTLRYSATHRKESLYNLMYRLTPVDAYNEHLVKTIEVSSVLSDQQTTKPYIKLLGVSNDTGFKAKLEIYVKGKDGAIAKKTVTAKLNSDLWDLSKEVDYYQGNGYIVEDMNAEKGEEDITFSNGDYLRIGESVGDVSDEALKRAQIRETIDIHMSKERKYLSKGIKVLSLIFIDKVANYRVYDNPNDERGQYAKWFEEEFNDLINGKYKTLKEMYPNICWDATRVHQGYFSQDGRHRFKDTSGVSDADDTTYNLIMQEKEKLLSIAEPVRFIFSHTALKEGWDNPNVFQVCTLVETKDSLTKRQKIGRGLRIAVNQEGERVQDYKYNLLSVIANESYKDFATSLQKEFTDSGYKFGIIESVSFAGLTVDTYTGEKELKQEDSEKIFDYLKKKGYIGNNNKATDKFYIDYKEHKFELDNEYHIFTEKVAKVVENLSKTIEIKNKNEKVKVSKNNKVINSEIFNDMWNRIKQKTIYSVNIPIEEMKKLAVNYMKSMPKIEPERIRRERIALGMKNGGVFLREETAKYGKVADINELEQIQYPDFIRRLQEATSLLRKTIIEIVAKSGKLSEFYVNPELFIKYASAAINKAKKEKLIDGIVYRKLDNQYYRQEEIFDDTELYGYKDKNIVDVSENNKNPYDYVIFDSIIEKQFAEACDEDDEVKLYCKLPSSFKIDTPFGGYNPDWMVVIQKEGEEHRLYFIAETKGSMDESQLKSSEKNKIFCGRKHFEVVDSELKYDVFDTLSRLKGTI